jgi:transcriptional regulator with XRE-family HTH domain
MDRHSSRDVGVALRLLRERSGQSATQVSRMARVSPAELRSIESGDAQPGIGVLDRVARALGSTLAKLVDGAPAPAPSPTMDLDAIVSAVLALPNDGHPKLEQVEAAVVIHAMSVADQNQSAAARLLGMERKAFVRRLARAKRGR